MRVVTSISLMTIGLLIASLGFAEIDPETVEDGHVWLLEDIGGNTAKDSSKNGLDGTIGGDPKVVEGIVGNALQFDGAADHITIPNAVTINLGTFSDRTIKAIFNCDDVSIKDRKQMIYEEGGDGKGLNVYVFDGEVYVGKWEGGGGTGEWPSTPIESGTWYEVALVVRDAAGSVDDDKLEMWLNGELVHKAPTNQLTSHQGFIAIGMISDGTVFPDTGATGASNMHFFQGLIDEVWVLNEALEGEDLVPDFISVEAIDKLAGTWGTIKAAK